jgi:hypothetical protein
MVNLLQIRLAQNSGQARRLTFTRSKTPAASLVLARRCLALRSRSFARYRLTSGRGIELVMDRRNAPNEKHAGYNDKRQY